MGASLAHPWLLSTIKLGSEAWMSSCKNEIEEIEITAFFHVGTFALLILHLTYLPEMSSGKLQDINVET